MAKDSPTLDIADSGDRVKTGIRGLDEILGGGLPAACLYLIRGAPGTGKTTLALQFLLEAVRLGQPTLYVTLSESKEELLKAAESHGWSLDGIDFHELEKSLENVALNEAYTFFHPADVELGEIIERVCSEVDRLKPTQVVFDSVSEMRLLAQDPIRYRRQILALKNFFKLRKCTVLLLDDGTVNAEALQLQAIVHGVFSLENLPTDYGTTARRLLILKMRGLALQEGYHDYEIARGGLRVYPRLNAAAQRGKGPGAGKKRSPDLQSDIAKLDELLGGGVEYGTSTLIIGPSGAGKSSLATQYVWQALKREQRVACYLFEESRYSFLARAAGLGMDLQSKVDQGNLTLIQVDPSKLSSSEFAFRVKEEVETKGVGVILIDSLNGYLNAMPSDRYLVIQMHELLTYLSDQGILTFLILAQRWLMEDSRPPVDVSYMADTIILLRHLEVLGSIKKVISVIKKRAGSHANSIREFSVTSRGLVVGDSFENFHGVLSGIPVYTGPQSPIDRSKSSDF